MGVKAPKIWVFGLYFMRETTVLRLFLAFLVKVGRLEGRILTEMVEQKYFTLHQILIFPKTWKFGLLGLPNWIFQTVFHDRNVIFGLFSQARDTGSPKLTETVLEKHFNLNQTFGFAKRWKFGPGNTHFSVTS